MLQPASKTDHLCQAIGIIIGTTNGSTVRVFMHSTCLTFTPELNSQIILLNRRSECIVSVRRPGVTGLLILALRAALHHTALFTLQFPVFMVQASFHFIWEIAHRACIQKVCTRKT